jgi:hypothetical protein
VGASDLLLREKRTLQGETYLAFPSLKRGMLQEKKIKTPTTGAQRIKTLTKTNSRCLNLSTE